MDIGNSHVGVGAVRDGKLGAIFRIGADDLGEVGARLADAWQGLSGGKKRRVVCSSVHPELLERVRRAVGEHLAVEPLIIGRDVDFPLELAIDNPENVGADRVCSAAAAHEKVKGSVAVADFGTAITIDCVSAKGVFLGGTILPGLAMSAGALHDGTASLPLVPVRAPARACGRDTAEAISSGILLGAIGALREIVERFATELGEWPHLVVCGGDAEAIAAECDFINSVVPDLCLRGVVLAYRKHLHRGKSGRKTR